MQFTAQYNDGDVQAITNTNAIAVAVRAPHSNAVSFPLAAGSGHTGINVAIAIRIGSEQSEAATSIVITIPKKM